MLFEIFKRMQLFCFAFSISASALIVTALSTGSLDNNLVQNDSSEFGLSYLEENPEVMTRDFLMAVKVAASKAQEPAATELPTDYSLANVRSRIGL